MRSRINTDERGATLIMLILCLTALMALSGLALDGGRMFSERRQNQNAADASALAGANVMRNEMADQTGTITTDQIWAAVQSTATSDNIPSANITCYFINTANAPSDGSKPCSSYTSASALPAGTFGVYVSTSLTDQTTFMNVVGVHSFNTYAHAAAAVESATFTAASGIAPVEICAVGSGDPLSAGNGATTASDSRHPNSSAYPLLVPDPSHPLITDPLHEMLNTAAVGETYVIKGNGVKKECGTNGSFKGIACLDNSCPPNPVPGYWPDVNGNHSGPFRSNLAASCNGTTIGCTFALPLCYAASLGPLPQSGTLYCVTWGTFQVTSMTANSDEALFNGQAFTQTGGQGGGIPPPGSPAVVKLVQ